METTTAPEAVEAQVEIGCLFATLKASAPEAVEAQVEIGCLFATLKASFVGEIAYGAHVDLDGTIIANMNLRHLDERADAIDKVRALRAACLTAIRDAHREIGAEFDKRAEDFARAEIVKLVPMTPATIAVYGSEA